jgi:uncharacterized membrane protein
MPQNYPIFPTPGINEASFDRLSGNLPPLQAQGNLTYIEFISAVKALWENAYPNIKIKPVQNGDYAEYPVIAYGLELRRAHSVEPKPRSRISPAKDVVIFGQRFQNIISFTVITKADSGELKGSSSRYSGPEVAEKIIETFEDFMLEYTPVFKRLGASELVYARRLSDSEENRDATDVNKRTVTYMLTTEKLIGMEVGTIEKIVIDVRRYMAVEKEIWDDFYLGSTPTYDGTELNIIDLNQSATPDS